jgi:alkylhydroperoxidase family enzyme
VAAIVRDFQTAPIDEPTRALLNFAVQLTHYDPPPSPADLDILRAHGFSDCDIHDAAQIIGYFNYIVRVADALGVPLDPWLVEFEAQLNAVLTP